MKNQLNTLGVVKCSKYSLYTLRSKRWTLFKIYVALCSRIQVLIYVYQGFQRDGTVQLFGTTGQKFLHCPGTKGQRDKLKILPRDGTGRDSQNPGRAGTFKIRDRTRDKTGQSRKGCSKTGNGCSKTGKDVLKQERMF